ncbi:MAG: glycoside hydrolase family 3 protein [Anaerolineae bacterium]|nr:glycoside hydrolase family 3 protein [Anaerolineae bacterium]
MEAPISPSPLESALPVAPRVSALLEQMTLAEKIGQMSQVEKNSITPDEVARFAIGSVLSGGGGNPSPNTPQSWAAMVRAFQEGALQSRLAIPLIYGVDAVHGHNNVVGATVFPHNVALGAARDPALVEAIAAAGAREILATNIHWDFAPCVAVPQDIRWGRTFEGFGEDPELVSALGAAYVRGMQNQEGRPALDHPHTALACPKHFVGDGGATWGTASRYPWLGSIWTSDDDRWSIDQGVTAGDEATLRAIHLAPYVAAIAAGARNIMVSYTTWNGLKMHAHHYLLTGVLKGELGFTGFLVSDWMAVQQLDSDLYKAVVIAINAGLDMAMVPHDYRAFIAALTAAVENGDIPKARIDDAVSRILTVKFELGLFEQPFGDESLLALFGAEDHRDLARQAVRQSLVLLKNEGGVLPLSRELPRLLVAGRGADDIGIQCGGWTVEWMGGVGPITPGATLLDGLRTAAPQTELLYDAEGAFGKDVHVPVGLAVVGELPYAEGEGDRADLNLSAADRELLQRVRQHCDRLVVVIYSGRPLIIAKQLVDWDALVAAWLPGSEAAGIAGVLFGDFPFRGRLPYTWPRDMGQVEAGSRDKPLFPYGFGL